MTENNKYSKEFLNTLKELCLEFDSKAESYPDPDYVGFALYYYATHPDYNLTPGYGGSTDIQTEFCEGGKEWVEELNKGIEYNEVQTLKLPNNHFLFHLAEDKIDEIIRLAFSHIAVKKDELFQDEYPGWLADSFIIAEIKYEHGPIGTVEIYPYDELCTVDETTMVMMENKNKHEVIGMIVMS
ncbi:MAG: hypothetical protein ABFD07_14190 [Methanobacterium sp.]